MRSVDTIIVHHSDSDWGQVTDIRQWHRDRGFNDIGYHYVILNQYPTYNALRDHQPSLQTDGMIQDGRDVEIVGAHAKGHNEGSIGICLIGKDKVTTEQLKALRKLIAGLIFRYKTNGVDIKRICGHRDVMPTECPGFDVASWWTSGQDEVTE